MTKKHVVKYYGQTLTQTLSLEDAMSMAALLNADEFKKNGDSAEFEVGIVEGDRRGSR